MNNSDRSFEGLTAQSVTRLRESGEEHSRSHGQERTHRRNAHRRSDSEVCAGHDTRANAISDQEIEDDHIEQTREQARRVVMFLRILFVFLSDNFSSGFLQAASRSGIIDEQCRFFLSHNFSTLYLACCFLQMTPSDCFFSHNLALDHFGYRWRSQKRCSHCA